MRVFLTGASGFIGLAVTKDLVAAGHTVLGLSRSDAGAKLIKDAGGEVVRGSLQDQESLKAGAAKADSVIHCAFDHAGFDGGMEKFVECCQLDKQVIETLGDALNGSDRLLIVSAGVGITPGRLRTENDPPPPNNPFPRLSEETAVAMAAKGARVSTMRLPQVHDTLKQGLVTWLVKIAQKTGVSAYVGDGQARWPAAHIDDVARLYRLAAEEGKGDARYHAVAEEGVRSIDIAEALGKTLKLPVVKKTAEEAKEHFGFLAMFMELDMPTSSKLTQERLGWKPTGVDLLTDLKNLQVEKLKALAN